MSHLRRAARKAYRQTPFRQGTKRQQHRRLPKLRARLICAFGVSSAEANGDNGNTAYRGQHENCTHDHDKGKRYINRAEGIRADAVADEDAVDYREQKIAHTAQHRRDNIFT